MGLRRLRGRLDQLQGKANLTMDDARQVLALAGELVQDLQDGIGVRVHVDANAAGELARILLGRAGNLPISVSIDPTWDTEPPRNATFVGGPYDGREYIVDGRTRLTLEGGHKYRWDGHVFRYSPG